MFLCLFPGHQACSSPCSFHCNHTGRSETGSPENQGGGSGCKVQEGSKLETGALRGAGGQYGAPSWRPLRHLIGLPFPRPRKDK